MRTILYTCNGCGKSLQSRSVIKVNVHIQRGNSQIEKKVFDFCSPCFLRSKSAFLNSMKPEEEILTEAAAELVVLPDDEPVVLPDERTKALAIKSKDTAFKPEKDADRNTMVLGPISAEERVEILRLHVENGLSADQIAKKLNRLPKGIKRALNSALKSGELDSMQRKLQEKHAIMNAQLSNIDAEICESNPSSGASNAGVKIDSYTVPSQTEVIYGRRYDVGGILSLAKAGWPCDKIAEEKHYDVDVVRVITEKYL